MLRLTARLLWPTDGISIRRQFGLAAAFLCLTVVAVLAVATTFLGRRTAEGLARNEMVELAGTMLDNLQHGMFERFREMQLLAELELTADVLSADPVKAQAVLERIQSTFQHYAWIGITSPDGIVRAATNDVLTGDSVETHTWFQHGLSGPNLRDVGEVPAISDLMQVNPAEPIQKFVTVSTPVRKNDGTLVGVLAAHIRWQWAEELRRAILAPRDSTSNTEIQVLSRDGVVLLGPRLGERLFAPPRMDELRTAGHGVFVDDSSGGALLTGFAVDEGYRDYPGLGWAVVARQPAEVAFRPVHHLVGVMIGLGLVVAAAAILVACILAHRITGPIRELTHAADRIGHNPDCTMFPRLNGPSEVVRLSSVLRLLLCRIGFAEQRTLQVENRAEQETRQLNENINQLRRLADTDPLTGLLNRRAILTLAEAAMKDRTEGIGILMIDIDHFKSINDRYGHDTGDAAIQAAARSIVAAVRSGDTVARFGGEEFIVLMRHVSLTDLVAQGERIRRAIESDPVMHAGYRINITISCGAAVLIDADTGIADVIRRADQALYDAKNQGRNRVCCGLNLENTPERAA